MLGSGAGAVIATLHVQIPLSVRAKPLDASPREVLPIKARWRTEPFQPIRVYVSDGWHYDAGRPEMIMVGQTQSVIGLGSSEEKVFEEFAYCDPVHITRIEPIDGDKTGERGQGAAPPGRKHLRLIKASSGGGW